MTAVAPEPVPIELDADDVYRVGGTRIPLETVITAYDQGWSPEEIVHAFRSLDLGDVYAVITYRLRHRAEVDAYLARQEDRATKIQQEIEKLYPSGGLRERLLARLS
jgi:uncharacterized protein (DUF433 family)